MGIVVSAKGDSDLLKQFKEGDFSSYELHMKPFLERSFSTEFEPYLGLPKHIKVVSLHNPTRVFVNGKLHPFDLSAPGKIGEVSLHALQKSVLLAEKLSAKIIVIHGATWNPYQESRGEALKRLCVRVKNLKAFIVKRALDIVLSFETDALWHNLYYSRRALLTSKQDFLDLERMFGTKICITPDFEHLSLSFHFKQFVASVGGEEKFLSFYPEQGQKKFEKDYVSFTKRNFAHLQEKFKEELSDFFETHANRINHLHINGSDCCNFVFDPEKTLPLIGEHLPIGFSQGAVSDKLDYRFISQLLEKSLCLGSSEEVHLVMEVWPRNIEDFYSCSLESRDRLLSSFRESSGCFGSKKNSLVHGGITMNTQLRKKVKIGKFEIKDFGRPFTIAEIGSNHNGSIELGKKMIDAAVAAGADAAKFQAFDIHLFSSVCYEDDQRREETITSHSALRKHLTETHKNTLKEEMEQHVASKEMLRAFKEYCDEVGILFFCTPLNKGVTDFLVDDLGMEFIKVASMDLNNLPFLEYLAKKGKPIILSTGMGTFQEVVEAVNTIAATGNEDLVILHCISLYPPKDEDIHLNNMDLLRSTFPYPIGFSDHSFGTAIPLAAVAKGACVIEKHFTLDKTLPGWDHKISADPEEMKVIVEHGQKIQKALGSYNRIVTQEEKDKKALFGRSVVLVRDMQAGEKVTEQDIDYRRPGTGLEPKYGPLLIGRTLRRELKADDLVSWEHFH